MRQGGAKRSQHEGRGKRRHVRKTSRGNDADYYANEGRKLHKDVANERLRIDYLAEIATHGLNGRAKPLHSNLMLALTDVTMTGVITEAIPGRA